MTSIATRPLLPLLALLLVTLIPVAYHGYGNANHDACADPAGLLAVYEIPGSYDERERWDRHANGWIQWTEGKIDAGRREVEPLSFRIVRSYRGRRIYLRPTSFLPEKLEPDTTLREQNLVVVSAICEPPAHTHTHTAGTFTDGQNRYWSDCRLK